MSQFFSITQSQKRKLRSFFADAIKVDCFEDLEQLYLVSVNKIISNENPCWNNWNAERTEIISIAAHDQYADTFAKRFDSLLETLPTHPIFHGKEYREALNFINNVPGRISDHISSSDWKRNNALYHEVYRHVDADYQLAYHFVDLGDRSLNLTLNRPTRDFDDSEIQVCNALGQGLAVICKRLEKQITLKTRVDLLNARLSFLAGLSSAELLTPKETLGLGELFQAETISEAAAKAGVSSYTFTERLGSIREKLGLQNTLQLRALLSAFMHKNT